jgi:hypothetical protein
MMRCQITSFCGRISAAFFVALAIVPKATIANSGYSQLWL